MSEKMLGLNSVVHHRQPLLNPPISKFPIRNLTFFASSSSSFQSKALSVVRASNGDDDNLSTEEKPGPDGGDGPKKDGRPRLNIRWGDLLNPDPDNIVAVGLTGVLTWASVQVVAQLFFVTFAILVAALKYSFIAALLLFILITLL